MNTEKSRVIAGTHRPEGSSDKPTIRGSKTLKSFIPKAFWNIRAGRITAKILRQNPGQANIQAVSFVFTRVLPRDIDISDTGRSAQQDGEMG